MYGSRIRRYAVVLYARPRLSPRLKRRYPNITLEFIAATNFLGIASSNQERAWYVLNNVGTAQLCATCLVNKVPFNKEARIPRRFCCSGCTSKHPDTKQTKQQTFLRKYGYVSPFCDRQSNRTAIQMKYGVDNASKLDWVKAKKQQTVTFNYGDVDAPPRCMLLNTDRFIQKARQVHGQEYEYDSVHYTSNKAKVEIRCRTHGLFHQRPNDHLTGNGCPMCGGRLIKTNDQFVEAARAVHGDKYDYSLVSYGASHDKVVINCPDHGPFEQTPNSHVSSRSGCPRCTPVGYSGLAILWLDKLANDQSISIQHAENGGEFKIPGTRWRADGYCTETNTIYEFHGDACHGNPNIFLPETKCNPWSDRTATQLYHETLQRENTIRSLGYNLVVQWENDERLLNRVAKHGLL